MLSMLRGIQVVLLMVGVLLQSSVAFAENDRTYNGKKIVGDDDSDTVVRDSSEANRQDKNWLLDLELIGFTPLASSGLGAGWYINPDMILDAAYTRGKESVFDISVVADTAAVRFKKFEGNSFYWRLGILYRTISFDASILAATLGASNVTVKGSAYSLGPELAIGNQWQWSNFTMGCDWIGYFTPVVSNSTVDSNTNAKASDYDDAKSSMKKLANTGNWELLRFYLGVSF